MSIYFARAGETGLVKIGYTDSADARMKDIQVGCPETIHVLRVIDGGYAHERWLHERFGDQRARGEWFAFSPDMLTVDVPAAVGQLPPQGFITSTNDANRALAEQLKPFGAVFISARIGVSRRTAENWLSAETGPSWAWVVAMLQDDDLAPAVLRAAGRGDLAATAEAFALLRKTKAAIQRAIDITGAEREPEAPPT